MTFVSFSVLAIPKPVGLYPLNKAFGGKDAGPNNENGVISNVDLSTGPNGETKRIIKLHVNLTWYSNLVRFCKILVAHWLTVVRSRGVLPLMVHSGYLFQTSGI